MVSENKTICGSQEWCAFPSLGIPAIKARVDSGAKTSSIHAFNFHPFKRSDQSWIRFDVHPLQNDRKTVVRCEAPLVDKRYVKSSSGYKEKRFVVRIPMQLGTDTWEVDATLTNRDSMGYRMLLGREAMSGRLLVDPASHFTLGKLSSAQVARLYNISSQSRDGLKIGLLASNPELYSNKRLLEAGKAHGHEMLFLDIRQCYMTLNAETPEIQYRGDIILNDLDAIIPRIRPDLTFYGCALTRHFENIDVFSLNSSNAIGISRDKLHSLQLFQKNGLAIPKTSFASAPVATSEIIEMVGGAPVVIKRLQGTGESASMLAHTLETAETEIHATKPSPDNLLVQDFITEVKGKNLRCFVIDGKVVASMEQSITLNEETSSMPKTGTFCEVRISREERSLAIKAAKTTGLEVAGVDIIRSSAGPLLQDVISSPGLEGLEATTGKDIAGMMITAIEKAVEWQVIGTA